MAQQERTSRDAANAAAMPDRGVAGDPSSPAVPPPREPSSLDQSAKDIAICGLVAVCELVLVLVGTSGGLPLPSMLLAHCAIMLGVTLVLDQRERNRLDSRVLAVAVVTTAVSGPIGAALTALLGVYLRYRKIETELLTNWYERISGHTRVDAVVEMHERIQAGRTLNPYVDARARFAAILRSGPMEEKQRVLSIITQKYHPDFAALLELALRNEDPPIRVQAAAVVAKLKELERLKIKALMGEAESTASAQVEQRLEVGARIVAALASGLLDEQDAGQARALAKVLARDALAQNPVHAGAALLLATLMVRDGDDAGAAELLEPWAARGMAEARDLLRACLIRQRRFAQAAVLAPAVPIRIGDAA